MTFDQRLYLTVPTYDFTVGNSINSEDLGTAPYDEPSPFYINIEFKTVEIVVGEFHIHKMIAEVNLQRTHIQEVGFIAIPSPDYDGALNMGTYDRIIYNTGVMLSTTHRFSLTELNRLTYYKVRAFAKDRNGDYHYSDMDSIFVKPPRYVILSGHSFVTAVNSKETSPNGANPVASNIEDDVGTTIRKGTKNTDSFQGYVTSLSTAPPSNTSEAKNSSIKISSGVA